jgi:LuxR family maltose regulon positive regulatory protein
LLKTKLYIPPPHPSQVPRPRLIECLNAGLGRKLTLVSAPAGSGKTTVLGAWAASCRRPVAWLSLEDSDNDPVRFLTYLVAALQTILPGIGEGMLSALEAAGRGNAAALPVQEAALTALLNELGALANPILLVLDDYYLITSTSIHNTVTFIVDHMPAQMHLVISTRADPPFPLSRLRGRLELSELRLVDLRFTLEEATELLNDLLGLELSSKDIATLEQRTEGWIVGLRMAGLSLQGQSPADKHGFVVTFAGDDRYVVDYLMEEVFRALPELVQTFLLQTSILNRLCGALCEAVTGQDDGQVMLESLEQANLFLVPLDAKRRWYRYHHLFSDLLRQRLYQLLPERVTVLHQRASEWYEQHELSAEAVDHALAAHDFVRAACLIERTAWSLLPHGQVTTLLGWFDALPDRLVRDRPRLGLIRGWTLVAAMQLEAIEQCMCDVEQKVKAAEASPECVPVPDAAEAQELLGEVNAIRATAASIRGDMPAAMRLAHEALAQLSVRNSAMRGAVTNILGAAYDSVGDAVAAGRAFSEAAELSRAAGNILIAHIALGNLSRVQQIHGRLHEAAETCRSALQMAATGGGPVLPAAGTAHVGLAAVLREWNDLNAARGHLDKGIELGRRAGIVELVVAGSVMLARVHEAQGDLDGAVKTIQEAARLAKNYEVSAGLIVEVAACRARLLMAQGHLEVASRWAHESGLDADCGAVHLQHTEYLVLAQVLIASARSDQPNCWDQAMMLLGRLLQDAEAQGRMGHAIEVLALQASALQERGETAPAMDALARALSIGEPEGYVRTFVDMGAPMSGLLHQAMARGLAPEYVRKLLVAFGGTAETAQGAAEVAGGSPSAGHSLVEPLSEREMEVLMMVVAGLSNREIARRLVITEGTAKWHVHNIYGKLAVHSRTQAVARAKELSMI